MTKKSNVWVAPPDEELVRETLHREVHRQEEGVVEVATPTLSDCAGNPAKGRPRQEVKLLRHLTFHRCLVTTLRHETRSHCITLYFKLFTPRKWPGLYKAKPILWWAED